jgi:hypothetical protein
MDKRLRLEHAYHNESTCYYLENNGSFPDWVITTAFYTCLHMVSYKIFPINVRKRDGSNISVRTVEQYKNFQGLENDKHSVLAELVADELPHIAAMYEEIKGYCMTARYHSYRSKPQTAKRAIEIMKEIKYLLGFPDALPPSGVV